MLGAGSFGSVRAPESRHSALKWAWNCLPVERSIPSGFGSQYHSLGRHAVWDRGSILECFRCRASGPADAAYCYRCGTALSAPAPAQGGTRRLLTVLFSDLSGYTAMNEVLDPEEVSEVLGRIKEGARRIVEAHGGVVNQFVGDEVMALFGMPTAHEDDARRAVSAALEMHRFVGELSAEVAPRLGRPLHLHTGLTTGTVLVRPSDIRDGLYSVTGDTVNTAARLLSKAEQDEILIGAPTSRLAAPFFQVKEREPLDLKGKARRVPAYRVLGPAARTSFEVSQRRGLTAYIGRQKELKQLEGLLARTVAGEHMAITVAGPPGLGKSRLLYEVEHRALQWGMLVLHGRCEAYGSVTPYQPFLHVLRDLLGLTEEGAPREVRARVDAAVRVLENAELERRLPFLLHLLSLNAGQNMAPGGLEGDQLRRELAETLRVLLHGLAHRLPVLLMLEDWHWADAASDAALRYLVSTIEGFPVMFLVNHRDDYCPRWGSVPSVALRLGPLQPEETASMVRALLGGAGTLPERLFAMVHERTGGNPFFIEEVCRALLEGEEVVIEEAGPRLTRELTRLDVPDSVQAVVRARIDRLGAAEAEVLALAAVVGTDVPLRLLERLVEAPERLPDLLERLKAAEMLWEDGEGREQMYRFKHLIIHDVAYGSQMLSQRRGLHIRVGEVLEELSAIRPMEHFEALAHHYGRGEQYGKASLYAELAGDKAAQSHALEAARRQYERALEFLEKLDRTQELMRRRVELVIRWSKAALHKPSTRQVNALEECYAISLEIGYPKGAMRCGFWAGFLQYALGNQAEAVWHFERVLPLARELGDGQMVAQIQLSLGQSFAVSTEYQQALECFSKGMAFPPSFGVEAHAAKAYAMGYLGMLHGDQGRFDEGYRCLEEGLRMVRTLGRRSLEGSVVTLQAMVRLWQGDWNASLEAALWLRSEAERMGGPFIIAMSKTVEGFARFHLSGGAAAITLLSEAVSWLEENDTRLALSWNQACLAEALALEGRGDEARRQADRALTRALSGDRRGEAMAHRALGLAAARSYLPDHARALEHLEKSIEVARRKDSPREEALSRFRMAESLRALGRRDEAAHQLGLSLPRLEEMNMVWYRQQAHVLWEGLAGALPR
ncbi:Adenylate/guanylate cyclase [Stigmatella aurantiaca DW4/3-1]|uniref:Adenylate/guanylate cyclase n=1 Tax=Stigmatella aurantiaca (strain DW4/3-1) TaxID=378806 RepID=E3FWL3_STIAD|nr:Adenylate/guanylate cyclase [Stigmatella aurantiaca DW4/3-1]